MITLLVAAAIAGCTDQQQVTEPRPLNSSAEAAAANQPAGAPDAEAPALASGAAVHPCRIQDGEPVPANRIRAVGNEPFWGARIDGRCVTYSTPEDHKGTRIWTRFSGTAEQGVWAGALAGRRFEMRTSPQPDCSDTMSDKVYPIEVRLVVRGEERRGCAEPLAAGQQR